MIPNSADCIKKTFSSSVSKNYELVNHLLTFGMDILWRSKVAKIAAAFGGSNWADMCSGTGDLAANLRRLAPQETSIHAIDFSPDMLSQAMNKPEAKGINFVVSDVKQLDFPDNSFDLITISFATRNLNVKPESLKQAFTEFHRVLKPAGLFLNLETSQPASPLIRKLYHLFIKLSTKQIGGFISPNPAAYKYLAHTIPRFHNPKQLSKILADCGFKNISFKQMMFGAAAIHQGTKA